MPLVIVGVSASHDASACVMINGRVVRAIQLERVTREKHDGVGFLQSEQAIRYCLRSLGLTPGDVDAFAYNCQPLSPEYIGLSVPVAASNFTMFDAFAESSIFVSHHLAHAYSAFASSGFERGAVWVADGSGGVTADGIDFVMSGPELRAYCERSLDRQKIHTQSFYRFGRDGYTLLAREFGRTFNVYCGSSSLGETYAAATQYLFDDWRNSGKLMGLAPYGNADAAGPTFLEEDHSGRLVFGSLWKLGHSDALLRKDPLDYADLAARIQADFGRAMMQRADALLALTEETDVAYTGGLALNSVANDDVRKRVPGRFFVFPASSDAGIAVGCATAAHHRLTGTIPSLAPWTEFLGRPYSITETDAAIARREAVLDAEPARVEEIAARLEAGEMIGVFRGGSEFGPRALGHRSIIADPRHRATWTFINRYVKFREDFRPFAPMVPEELANRYFEIDEPSPYMLRVVAVRPEYRDVLAAVTHVDGSARVQTVNRTELPEMHALLQAFGRRTGLPILLNTSLNVRGEPIVETPDEAIEALLTTHLSAMLIENVFVKPRSLPQSGLDQNTVLHLAPDVELICIAGRARTTYELVARKRGPLQYRLERWQFELLRDLDGHRVTDAVEHCESEMPAIDVILGYLTGLIDLRLLLVASPLPVTSGTFYE